MYHSLPRPTACAARCEKPWLAQTSFAYAGNRALLFRGSIFHQTAAARFAEGFENRRRNVTMLFRRTHS